MGEPESLETVLEQALELADPQARAAYLADACGDNEAMRAEVESLLVAHRAADSDFMDTLVDPVWSEIKGEQEGDTIGRYKLLQQIGEGGFGTVYMAEQREPVKRRVALKVIKAGMDSKEVIARFEAERQALALMDHPHIAKVHDAGTTDGGRPYFVMELVKGVPLTKYCADQDLDTKARLELFADVCAAVQHAHQKGVIHRDLKPGNIMVSPHDGKPVVKVIDFGIAKAISMELTEKTVFTQMGRMIGTPQYMSPEQAELNALDVDTRSDIYSLGVVLYELLTGTTPLESEQLRSAAYGEMQRLIREETPPKPSTKLAASMSLPGSSRGLNLKILPRHLRGDLDWIVLKALEKERSRRYATSNALAQDILRHLRDEPVVAGPPGIGYKMRKFVQRHRNTLAVAATITFLLAAGIFGALWFAKSSREAEIKAETEARKAMKIAHYGEARALLGRASLLVLEDKNFEAAMLAAAALGFRGFGAEQQPAEFANEYPVLLDEDKPEFDSLVQIATQAGATTRPVWQSPAGSRHAVAVRSVACSPDGTILACGRGARGIQIWDIASGTELRTLEGHSGSVTSVAFSPDGITLASGSEDRGVKLWNVSTGEEIRSLEDHQDGVSSVAFSPDGAILASGGRDNLVRLWNTSTGAQAHALEGHLDEVLSVAFSPDGQIVVSGGKDGVIAFWNVATGEEIRSVEGRQGAVMALAWSPGDNGLASGGENGTIKIWRGSSVKAAYSLAGHRGAVQALAFTPDGQTLASGGDDKEVHFWDISNRKELQSNRGHQDTVTGVAFSPDGATLVSGSSDRTIRIWNVLCSRDPKTLTRRINGPWVLAVDFSPDGSIVASGATDKAITLWNATTGREIRSWRGHQGEVKSVVFSPNGTTLVSGGGDRAIKLWNVSTGQVIRSLGGHSAGITSVAFSPDGATIASGSWDQTIKLWDVFTGRELRTLEKGSNGQSSLAFSPDGKRIASGSGLASGSNEDGCLVTVWDVSTGREIATLANHHYGVTHVAYNADGTALASAGCDGWVNLWPADYQTLDLASYTSPGNHWCKVEDSHLIWTAPEQSHAVDRKFDFLNVSPSTHLGILRSARSEEEKNVALFWCYVRAQNWTNSLALFPKLTATSHRGEAINAISRLQSSMSSAVVQRWKSVLDPARKALIKEWSDSSREKLERELPEEAFQDLSEALSLIAEGDEQTEFQELRRSHEALKSRLGLETPAERWAKLPNRLASVSLDPFLLEGLALHYSFEKDEKEVVSDSSGKGRHAKAAGGEWTDDPKTGGCYLMVKPGDEIVALDYKGVMGAKPRTVALWFKDEDTAVGPDTRLIRWGSQKTGQQICLRLGENKGLVADAMFAAKASLGMLRELLDGKWHHLAVTLPNGGKLEDLELYIDGKPVAKTLTYCGKRNRRYFATNPLNTTSGMPMNIGSDRVNGLIDEVMIWDRALDAAEIARLYKATGGLKMAPVVGMWNWENGATILINSDGTAVNNTGGGSGMWEFDDNHTLVISWNDGTRADTVVLSSNFQYLYGTNQKGKQQLKGVRSRGAIQAHGKQLSSHQLMARAALLFWAGKDAEHTALCEQMLAHADGTEDALLADTVAKISCLQEIVDPGLRVDVLALARRAVNLAPSSRWFQMTLGMAEYRCGNHAEGEKVLAKTIEQEHQALQWKRSFHISITASYYQAMALFKQGETTKSRTLFAATEAKMKPLPADKQNPLADGADHDDLILWLAYREAAALLGIRELKQRTLLFADNFNVPDTRDLDLSDQTGRRRGLDAAIQVRSARGQHGISKQQLHLRRDEGRGESRGSGRVGFFDDPDNNAGTPGTRHDWASGVTGARILADKCLRVEFDWNALDTTSDDWISLNVCRDRIGAGDSAIIGVGDGATDLGILFRFNGETEVWDNGENMGAAGNFPPRSGVRRVRIDFAFDSFADGAPVTMDASVDGTMVVRGRTFTWEGNAGESINCHRRPPRSAGMIWSFRSLP